jgi:hypothetical protein
MRFATCLLLILALGASVVGAAEGPDASSDPKTPPAVTGGIEVGYRDVSVDGNEDKYREDVNLPDNAFRVFGLDLAWQPENNGAIDTLTLDAQGLGGEPYTSARLRARKTSRWDLKASYTASDFFYRDAGYFFREGGDLHAWDTTRTLYGLDFTARAANWLTLRVGGDRRERYGHSTTTRDLQRNVFQLQLPVDQTATSYWLGADFRAGWVDITLEQRFNSFTNRLPLATANNDGIEPSGSRLDSYGQLQVQDADTPVSRIVLSGRPTDWIRFSAGYVRADTDLDYHVEGYWSGLDYDDSPLGNPPEPFATTLTNAGKVERSADAWMADVGIRPIRVLELTIQGARRSYDQDGTINSLEDQTGGKEQGTYTVQGALHNELQLDTAGLTLRWEALPSLVFTAGAGYQKRTADFQIAGPEVDTTRTTYNAGLRYQLKEIFGLRLEYERGSDEDPYTPVAPTDTDRLQAEATVRPVKDLHLAFRYKDETSRNDLTYLLGLPTDDVPSATSYHGAEFDVTSWGATLTWARGEKIDLAVGYDRTDIDSNADIVYVTGFTFVPAFDIFTTLGRTAYTAKQDAIYGQVRFTVGRAWSFGASTSLVRNDGTFPLDWNRYGADARYRHSSGVFARLAFDRYDLNEDNPYAGDPAAPTPDVNNYDANLWTVALGYRF